MKKPIQPAGYLLLTLCALLALCAAPFRAAAQPYCTTRSFNVADGLPSNSISTVAQGPDGLIWVATWNGLSYFDGYTFSTFRSGEQHGALTSNRIVNIAPDAEGKVWLLTYDRSPYLFDPSESRFIPLAETLGASAGRVPRGDGLFPAGGHMWITGQGGCPAMRVRTALPVDSASVEAYGRDKLRGGASRVARVVVDSLGSEWIFTDAGVQLYGSTAHARGIFLDPVVAGGVAYLATTDGKFYTYTPGASELKPFPAPVGAMAVSAVGALGDKTILAAVPGAIALCDLATGRWRSVAAGDPRGASRLYVDSRGRVWLLSDSGAVWVTDPGITTARRVDSAVGAVGASSSTVPLWVEDAFGTVWLAAAGGRFGFYDETDGVLKPQEFLLPHLKYTSIPTIDQFFVDRQKNLWIGTTHDLTLVNFNHLVVKTAPLVLNQEVRALLPRDDGYFYAGSRTGVLGRFTPDGAPDGYLSKTEGPDGRGRVNHSPVPVKFSDHIYAMYQDRSRDMWIGTKGDGLFRVRPDGSLRHFRHDPADPYSLPVDSIYDIFQDKGGNIWIASFGGGLALVREEADGSTRFIHSANELKHYPKDKCKRVRRVTQTDDGVILLSTSSGLVTFSGDFAKPQDIRFNISTHVPGDSTSLQTSDVLQTLVTSGGEIYVATMAGALQQVVSTDLLRPGLEFTTGGGPGNHHMFLRSSTAGGNILSMIEDTGGNIYIVRETSILVFSPSTGSIAVYGSADLGGSIDFTEAAPKYSPASGNLLFGGMGGVVFLNPDELARGSHAPGIIITGIQYQGEAAQRLMLNPDRFYVQGGKRNFAITFSALDYANNANIQYAYKLADDKDWTYLGTSHTAHFNHLPPGTHTLLVKSTDGNGVWLDNVRRVTIEVRPDFYESGWAKGLYVFLFLVVVTAFVYLFIAYRRHKLTKLMRRKEKQFFIEASHRLRTPLTLIGAPVTEVLENEPLSARAREHLEKVDRNSREMLAMVNGMLTSASDHHYITDDSVPADYPAVQARAAATAPAAAPEASAATADTTPPDSVARHPAGDRVKILVVEDNDDLRAFLCDILSVQYHVISAPNGAAGLEKAEREQPDFIVTDVTMPQMDGLTMVQKIKQNKKLSHIPIIVLSARASVEDRVRGLSQGVDDYITKPFSATYLRQRISNIRAQRKILQQNFFEHIGHNFNLGPDSGISDTVAPVASAPVAPVEAVPVPQPPATTAEDIVPAPEAESRMAPPPSQGREWKLESPQIADADQEMMEKLLKFMEEHIADEDLKIEELAEAVHMGRTVFYGKIKALVGMSPSDFLRRLRMQRAEELIARSKMNFSQIAFRIGFSDPKYFTKCFKKETGMTPSEYRQQAQRQNGAE